MTEVRYCDKYCDKCGKTATITLEFGTKDVRPKDLSLCDACFKAVCSKLKIRG